MPDELSLEGAGIEATRFLASYHDCLVDGLDTRDAESLLESRPDLARELETELEVMTFLEALVDLDFTGRSFGDFRLLKELGRGATGIVYEAYQVSLARHVALKILLPGLIPDSKALGRFLRGAKLAATVSHPNVVGVFTAGVEGGMPYFAMEYAQGETLQALLHDPGLRNAEPKEAAGSLFSGGSADSSKVADAFADAAEGLQAIHSHGIIHRDLKPGNLIVDEAGRVRILDFGLARLEGQTNLTITVERLGTPLYMSPEQASGIHGDLTTRTDIFSLGATLYEVLELRPPFEGRSYEDILSKIVHRDAVFSRAAGIPPPLQRIVLKCLRKDPQARYRTAEALAQDLRRFVRGDPVEAEDEPVLERMRRRLWRSRWALVKVGAAAFLVAGLTLAGISHSKAQQEAEHQVVQQYEEKVSDGVFLMLRKRLLTPPQNLLLAVAEEVSSPMESAAARLADPSVSDTSLVYQAKSFRFRAGPAVAEVESALRSAVEELEQAERILTDRPEAKYHLAMALQQLGDSEQALQKIESAIEVQPAFTPALALRAAILESLGRAEAPRAAELLRERLQDPALARAWIDAEKAWFDQDWKKAEEVYGALSANATWRESSKAAFLDHRIRLALVHIKSGHYEQALVDIASSMDRWQGRLEPTLLLGKVQYLRGQQEETERMFSSLHESVPVSSKSDAAQAIAEAYRDLGDHDRALTWVDRMDPALDKFLMRAEVLSSKGDHARAMESARRALDLAPGKDALLALAGVVLAGGEPAEARLLFEKAALLDPDDTRTLLGRASCLESEGDLAPARRIIEEALVREPGSGELHYNMGRLLAALGLNDDAMRHYENVSDREPVAALAHLNLGALLDSGGRFTEALVEYERAVELAPGLAVARYNLGWAYQRERRYKEAEAQYRGAIEHGLEQPFVYVRRGMCLQEFRRYDDAIQAYDRALAIERTNKRENPDVHHAKAHCHYWMGDYEMAVSEYRATLALDEERGVRLLSELGDCLEWTGAPEKAALSWRKAIGREPKFIWAHNSLARVILQGKCRSSRGDEADMLRLEDALHLPHASPALGILLEEHREAIAPRLGTFASVDAKLSQPDGILERASTWKFHRGTSEPPEWTHGEFDDSSWEEGKGAFGFPGVSAVNTPLPDMVEGYTSMYIRRRFQIADPSRIQSVLLRIRCDGGYAVYLNGKEVFRARAGGLDTPMDSQSVADEFNTFENGFWVCDEIHLDPQALVQGENVLALQGFKFPSVEAIDFRIDAELLAVPSFDADLRRRAEEALEAFRASATGPGDASRIAYFEARLLQYSGDPASALELYSQVRTTEPGRPEPALRSAECLEAIGERQAAAQVLHDAVEAGLAEHDVLWDAWFKLQADQSAEEILEKFPRLPPERPDDMVQHPMEIRWLLQELSSRRAVRINCGGAEHVGADGKAWGRDRFFRGGISFYLFSLEELESSLPDGAIHTTERFFREHRRPVEGYRFLLPNGSYRLALHFTEGWFKEPGKRIFDVLVQGKVFLEKYGPPYGVNEIKVLESVEVTEGLLWIDFIRRVENPKITAIEIERI